MEEIIYYIYVLIDPRDGRERYVGQTTNPAKRLKEHSRKQYENTHRANWLSLLNSLGISPIMKILEECNKTSWADRERYHIQWRKGAGYALVNTTDGGDLGGYWKGKTRPPFSDEWLANMSKSRLGNKRALGKRWKLSPEDCEIRRQIRNSWSEELKEKHRQILKTKLTGVCHSEETKKKVRGQNNPRAKLTEPSVIAIKKLLVLGCRPSEIGRAYNVTPSAISTIKSGRNWSHVTCL